MNALGLRPGRRHVLFADDDESWHPDAIELVLDAAAIDDATHSLRDPDAIVCDDPRAPLSLQRIARRIGEKGPSEENPHHATGHQAEAEPPGDEIEQAVLAAAAF